MNNKSRQTIEWKLYDHQDPATFNSVPESVHLVFLEGGPLKGMYFAEYQKEYNTWVLTQYNAPINVAKEVRFWCDVPLPESNA